MTHQEKRPQGQRAACALLTEPLARAVPAGAGAASWPVPLFLVDWACSIVSSAFKHQPVPPFTHANPPTKDCINAAQIPHTSLSKHWTMPKRVLTLHQHMLQVYHRN